MRTNKDPPQRSMRAALSYCLAILAAITSGGARAERVPLWEAGVGIAALSVPDYRGSEEAETYVLPFPYFVYRGDHFRIDREGITGDLFESKRLKLALSLNIGQPTDSDDNRARDGMPDLDPTFEIGPSLKVLLASNARRDAAWSLQFPLRAVFASDFRDIEFIGWLFSPHVNYEAHRLWGSNGWRFNAAAGPVYATKKYHAYFYNVAPRFATPARPAFSASGGYSGFRTTLSLTRRYSKFWVGSFIRYDYLRGAMFDDSPLFTEEYSFMAGVAVAWIFATSERMVDDTSIWW